MDGDGDYYHDSDSFSPQQQQQHDVAVVTEDRKQRLARLVVGAVVAAVEAAWNDLDLSRLLCSPSSASSPPPLSSPPTTDRRTRPQEAPLDAEKEEEEKEVMTEFVNVLRVRYAVEVAARVLATHNAIDLLLESEDGIVFDGTRLLYLDVTPTTTVYHSHSGDETHTAAAATANVVDAEREVEEENRYIPLTVLNLPGVEGVFYGIAYCMGTALQKDYANAIVAAAANTGGNAAASVIDVDASDDDDHEDEKADGGVGGGQTVRASSPLSSLLPSARQPPSTAESRIADEETVHGEATRNGDPTAASAPFLPPFGVSSPTTSSYEEEEGEAASKALRDRLLTWASALERSFVKPCTSPPTSSVLPYALRLWLYVWEYTLTVRRGMDAAADIEAGADEASEAMQRASTREKDTRIPLTTRTARRWLESLISTTLTTSANDAHLIHPDTLAMACAAAQSSNKTMRNAALAEYPAAARETAKRTRETVMQWW